MKNPWLGLKSYEEGDHLYGRGKEADELANIVMNSFHTIIYGKSGIGKTSLLRAGVFPTLRYEDFLPIYIRLEHDENADEDSYLRQIENALNQNQCSLAVETGLAPSSGKSAPSSGKSAPSSGKSAPSSGKSAAVQTEHAPSLQSIFSKYRFSKSRGIELTPVIVFDQFEEIFTLNENRNSTAVDKFFSDLSDILNNDTDSHNYRIVFCLREDYLYYIERLSESIPAFKRNRYCLQDLTHDEAMEVITLDNCNSAGVETRPATSPGTYVDVNTAEEILRKISPDNAEEYNATILSLYMSQLFDKMVKAGATTISSALVQQFGDDIISTFYFDSIAGISEKSIEYLEDHLVTTGGYRHNIPLEDAITAGVKQPEIDHLKDRRIINIQPRQGNILYMEYAHDVLCPIIVENRGQRALRKKAKRQRRIITVWVVSVVVLLGIIGTMVGLIWQISKRQEAMMLMQSRAIAGQAEQLIDQGKYAEGVALCLRALPEDWDNPDRPVTYKPISVLRSCLSSDFSGCSKILRLDCEVSTASFSPDGRYVVTGSMGDDIKIWNVSTGSIVKVLKGHTATVQSAHYSPDGRTIVSSSDDVTIRIWDVASGKQIKVIKGDGNSHTTANYSPDGKYIVTTSHSDSAVIWSVATGKEVKSLMKIGYDVNSASFSSDGKYVVASACNDRDWYVVIWNVETGKLAKTCKIKDGWVESISFCPVGYRVAVGTYSGTVHILDLMTGGEVIIDDFAEKTTASSVSYSPNGKLIAVAFSSGTTVVYDASTLKQVKTFKKHSGTINYVSFSPDSRFVATSSFDGNVMIWDMQSEAKEMLFNQIASCNAYGAYSPDGNKVVMCTANPDSGIIICETATGKCVKAIKTNCGVSVAAYSPDGEKIITYTDWMDANNDDMDSIIRIWNAKTGKMIRTINNRCGVFSASFNPDGRYIVTSSFEDSTVRIWNVSTGRLYKSIKESVAMSVSYSPDGRLIAVPSLNAQSIKLLNARTGKLEKEFKEKGAGLFIYAAFSADGRYLVSTSQDCKVKIWNVETGKVVRTLCHNIMCVTASFSPDSKYVVATAIMNHKVIAWNVQTGEQIVSSDIPFATSAAFSPDGNYILGCSRQRNVVKALRFYKPQELIDHFRKVVGDYKFTEDEEIKYYLK